MQHEGTRAADFMLEAKARVDNSSGLYARGKPVWMSVDPETIGLYVRMKGGNKGQSMWEEILQLNIPYNLGPRFARVTSHKLILEIVYDGDREFGSFRIDAHNAPTFWAEISTEDFSSVQKGSPDA